MEYLTVLTATGASKIATAIANQTAIKLTKIVIGDGDGVEVMPNASQTALVKQVFEADLTDLSVDANNSNYMVAEGYVPSTEGDFWAREVGILDEDGDLICVGNLPETYKPVQVANVIKDLYIKVVFEVSSSDAVTLVIDPSVILATREFVLAELTKYALLNGDSANKFKVADATAQDEAVNKKQLDAAVSGIKDDELVKYALKNGNNSNKFKVADATAQDEAVNKKQLNLAVTNAMPSGSIIMWHGAISAIPTGWFFCNGSNGTPDLRDRFIYGAKTESEVNNTGGSKDAIVVEHNHTGNTNTTGNHVHGGSSKDSTSYNNATTYDSSVGSNYSNNGNTLAAGNHSHTVGIDNAGESGEGKNLPPYIKLAYIMKG